MPETRKQQRPDQVEEYPDTIAERLRGARLGLTSLLGEAEEARRQRAEAMAAGDGAVCAWNHFENIPTFYNWNNRPR
ncbi:multiple cyclophane-containing RiPP AmcA [Micromonospora sp. NPDC003197]